MDRSNGLTRKQNWLIILVSVMILAVATVSTVVIRGQRSGDGQGGSGYQNVTFTDAVMTCNEYIRGSYAGTLRSMSLDDHSSRHDLSMESYKLFYDLEVDAAATRVSYSVNCFVSAGSGSIIDFEALELKDSNADDDDGLFGWRP
jgi:hypothetical protein